MNIYLIGHRGWIGNKIYRILRINHTIIPCLHRMEDRTEIVNDIYKYNPTHVIICAGITGRPNIDWCEDNKEDTIRSNVIGTLNVIDICYIHNIHCTYIATGCIYNYDNKHPCVTGKGFTENDNPNFIESWYSKSKVIAEDIIRNTKYNNNTLTLRIRMPISDNWESRSLIMKLLSYEKIINIPNSMTILSDMLPLIEPLMNKKSVGIYNFTNSGTITHNQLMDLYIKYIDPDYKYNNFTLYEHNKVIRVKRTNNKLDISKLQQELSNITIPDIKTSIENVMKSLATKKISKNQYYYHQKN